MSKPYLTFPKSLTNLRFGKLLVIKQVNKKIFHESTAWLCKCDCGRYKIKSRAKLLSGRYKSCGCLLFSKNGLSHTAEYQAWKNMIKRCCEHGKSYYRYGGRGVIVCERWRNSFNYFLADVGIRPSNRHTLERIDNDGNYEPKNVCWATRETQQNNTRRNVKALYNGEMLSISQISRALGCKESRLRWWLRKGFTPDESVSKAVAGLKKSALR